MNFRKGRWRLALGRLVNLRYINLSLIHIFHDFYYERLVDKPEDQFLGCSQSRLFNSGGNHRFRCYLFYDDRLE